MKRRGASGGSEEEEEEAIDDGDRSALTPTLALRALTPERSSGEAASNSSAASKRGLRVIRNGKMIEMPRVRRGLTARKSPLLF